MTDFLLPCPFCGGEGNLFWDVPYGDYVYCTICFAQGGFEDSPEDAVAFWNRRTGTERGRDEQAEG